MRTFTLLLSLFLLAGASTAYAQPTLVVLGIRSIEGDDEVANELTVQLRAAAGAMEDWNVSEQAVSMAQMSLAHGCDEIDAACLKEIALGLSADSIIFGTIRRNSTREDYDFSVSLSLFDAGTGGIERNVDDTLPQSETDPESLAERAQRLVKRLTSGAVGGAIAIQVNVDMAEVSVNGQPVGRTRDGGLRLEGLQPGAYEIELSAEGYASYKSTVTLAQGGEAHIAAALEREGGASEPMAAEFAIGPDSYHDAPPSARLDWLAYTLLGVAGASLVGAGVSALIVDGVNDDESFLTYKDAVARMNPSATDVCTEAENGLDYQQGDAVRQDVADMCTTADTFEVLQWVFLGTAVVSGGVGAYLLIAKPGSEPRASAPEPTWALRPTLGRDRAGLGATLRF